MELDKIRLVIAKTFLLQDISDQSASRLVVYQVSSTSIFRLEKNNAVSLFSLRSSLWYERHVFHAHLTKERSSCDLSESKAEGVRCQTNCSRARHGLKS